MEKVTFTRLQDGTAEEYAFLEPLEEQYCHEVVDRLFEHLRKLDDSLGGYQVSRLEHCLQSATRALRAGEDDDMIVGALLHDIGDILAPCNHDELAAAIVRPYLREEITWIVQYHATFQKFYYADKMGGDKNARNRFTGHPYFDACVRFCEDYDENCFDGSYNSMKLEEFRPYMERVFSRKPWDQANIKPHTDVTRG
ncbi:HD domain-containing protein [Kiloniella laminariae]|uniref:HD domain-containing protein n=1 Tax=Kiloniella laminariae TaxID=454162 RepID=UPI00036C8AD1|nr:HD domain-containing protein [Kiloniella laminariae]